MNKEIIKKILEIAVNAPSGENSQPWRFEVDGNKINILNLPERDQSLYNFGQRGSLVAHGALIENISIIAPIFGYDAEINLLPDNKDPNFIATLILKELSSDKQKDESLYKCIIKRVTNRKSYKSVPLDAKQIEKFNNIECESKDVKIVFVRDLALMKDVAMACSTNEQVMLENKFIHNFFFEHINWTEKEELEKRLGFYIKTLELPPPVQVLLKLFKNWSVMNFFNKLGLNKIIAKGNAANYAKASVMVSFAVKNGEPKDFIVAGRLMQKVWLKATEMGLSAQPMAGMLFFTQAISGGEADKFTSSQIELIRSSYKKVQDSFGINNEMPVMILRIGYADAPSAKSSKMPPNIVFEG